MYGFDIYGVNQANGTSYTSETPNVGETDKMGFIDFKITPPKKESFYPGLTLNYETRMQNEMENSPFMQGLNELFGI